MSRGARGDNQCVAGVCTGVALQCEWVILQFNRMNMVEDDLGIEALSVFQEAFHQFGALHAVGIGRPVFDIRGGHELPALRDTGNKYRVQVRTGGVNGSGVTGGTGTQDDQAMVQGRHGGLSRVAVKLAIILT